jgi:hypothetical protein
MKAKLRGIKKRHEATGTIPILIHTVKFHIELSVHPTDVRYSYVCPKYSPALVNISSQHYRLLFTDLLTIIIIINKGELADMEAAGRFSYEHVFNDTNVKQIESLPPTAWHRNVDLEIVKADKEGLLYALSYSNSIYTLQKAM